MTKCLWKGKRLDFGLRFWLTCEVLEFGERERRHGYLEAAVVCAEFLSQHGVEAVEVFFLQAAVHQHVDDLALLFVFQPHPLRQQ